MSFLRLSIITKSDRHQAITICSDTISRNEGWISGHTLLSNMAATLNFEIPTEKIDTFIADLQAAGFTPQIEALPKKSRTRNSTEDSKAILSITFIHDDLDLKRDVPAFG
jgi:hypothetical protein